MSRNMKIVLTIVVVVIGLCAVTGLASMLIARRVAKEAFVTDPTRMPAVGQEIAPYALPKDYSEAFSMNLGPAKMVMITRSDKSPEGMVFMLVRMPSEGTDPEQLQQQMKQMMSQRLGQAAGGTLEPMRDMEVILNGESVDLTESESESGADNGMRQISGVFNGPNGPVMLLVMGKIGTWDDQALNEFLNSLK